MKSPQEHQVQTFFDRLADTYPQRYTPARPFHRQLFSERLQAATSGLPLSNAAILDIGAGTGPLYNYLLEHHSGFDYYACDLSAKMLAQSHIPEQRRFVGTVEESTFPLARFDFIFALGLTTYLPEGGLASLLKYIEAKLKPEGRAILSFTNARSLDWRLHQRLRPLFRSLGFRRFVIGQGFSTSAYQPEEIKELLPHGLRIAKQQWLTPTLPLLSRLSPGPASALARKLAPQLGHQLYSDFLMHILSDEH